MNKRPSSVDRLIHMTSIVQAHIEADATAFRVMGEQIIEVNQDVKSLLASRSFLRGTWFALLSAGTFFGVVAGLVVAWFRP